MERFFRPASRLVVINSKNQILLARHKRYWALPGWGLDIWESIETALRRESIEELNIPAQMDKIIFIQDYLDERKEWKIHSLEYFCTLKNNSDFENVVHTWKDSSHAFELNDLAWFDVESFPEKFMPIMFPKVMKEYIKNKNNFSTKYISWIE
jgi:ADP-ribose pyrophosphatase YjhB (NUDIX family)